MSGHDADDSEGRRSLSDGLRKVLGSGVNALFVTEEGVRSALGDFKLPKDVLQFVMTQTERTRREVTSIITQELKGALEGEAMLGGIQKALRGLKIQVRAEVTFDKKGPKARAKSRVRKRQATEPKRKRL